MEFLPTADQQTWLVDALLDLLRQRGPNHFLSMPLVEPASRFFPDRWSSFDEGLDRTTRRLMQYATLGELDVCIDTFVQPAVATSKRGLESTASIAGAFLGIKDGCCYFVFNGERSTDGAYLAGVMGHEVAHAYRALHGLADAADPDQEEWLTDLTAVYLGFGILVANNSYRYRTAGEVIGAQSYTSVSAHRVGYLSPQAFAYLLAIQIYARDLDDRERRRLLRHLEANQAAFVNAASAAILELPDEILIRFEYPEQTAIPQVLLESILLPLPAFATVANPGQTLEVPIDPAELPNSGRPVFRLGQSRARAYSFIGLAVGLPLGCLIARLFDQLWPVAILSALGLAIGAKEGSQKQYDICSDPECEMVLEAGATTCPGCGGLIAGSIRHRGDRLAAEEEFELQQKSKRRGRPMRRRKPPRAP